MRVNRLLFVIPLGLLSFTLRAEPAVAGESASEEDRASLDKSYALPPDGVELIKVKEKVGPLVFEEIVLNNLPNDKEVQVAEAEQSGDKSRPKIAVIISNPTPRKMKAKMVASFEGADGTVYMQCDRSDGVKAFAERDRTNMCWLDSMRTRNWAKVKKVHITAEVFRDR